jgi:uncharacterized repeat protein (TIGR02543 family)
MINKNLACRFASTTASLRHSKRTFLVIGLFLALLFSSFSMIHLGQAQDNQMDPDWTNITHDFFSLSPATTEPVMTGSMVTDESSPVSYVADPFLYHEGNTWYMFFEVNLDGTYPTLPSDIGLATSSDGIHWTYDRIVLHDSFHLAYPYVFKYAGNYYMIPETFSENAVKLYEATNFPYSWEYVADLVTGRSYVDSSIFEFNGTLWLYSSTDAGNLYLFYSDGDFTNPASWHAHPMNPIVTGSISTTRGGGRVIVFDGNGNGNETIRLAQDDTGGYGIAVRAFLVDTLTTTNYHESQIYQSPLLQASGSGWNKDGMHQLDAWYTGSRWLAAVDGVNRDTVENWTIGIYQSPAYEYPLTISTNYGTVTPGNGSYGADSTQTITATHPVEAPGVYYNWQGWTGTGSGSFSGTGTEVGNNSYTASITMHSGITESASWKLQYYLTVSSAHGDTIGGGWFDADTSTHAGVTPTIVNGTAGTRYVFTGWSGDASGTDLTSDTIVMNGTKTAIASWKTQYYLNVSSAHGTTGGSGWYDAGTNTTATLGAIIVPGAAGTRYVFTGWSDDASGTASPSDIVTMDGPKSATANWQTQYNVTFAQSGVGSDFSGNVMTVNGTDYGFNGYSTWANASNIFTFSYSPQLVIANNSKQCLITGISGNTTATSTTASQPTTVSASYKTQYYLTIASTYDSPTPASGWYDSGTSITGYVSSPSSGYTCSGWSGTGSVPNSGSTSVVTFSITAPSTLTWNWASATPTPTPTPNPTSTPTRTPTPTASPTPSASPTASPTASPSATSSPTSSPPEVNNSALYIGVTVGVIVVAILIAFVVYRMKKK